MTTDSLDPIKPEGSDDPIGELIRDANKASLYGRLLKVGWIVRFKSPDVDFDEALNAGTDHMTEYFSDMIGGLRVGHVDELKGLGFFSAIKERTGSNVNVGQWNAIPAENLDHVVQIIGNIIPQATAGVCNILKDLLKMVSSSKAANCSIGFILADDQRNDWPLGDVRARRMQVEASCKNESCRRCFNVNLDSLIESVGAGYFISDIPPMTCEACGEPLSIALAMLHPKDDHEKEFPGDK